MRARLLPLVAAVALAGCSDPTPVIMRPVVHEVTLTFLTRQDDIGYPTYQYSEVFSGTLVIDFQSSGAAFDMPTQTPCMPLAGAITMRNRQMNGEFFAANEAPRMTMSGSADTEGVLSGSFSCSIRYSNSPHGPNYTGTFRATPRP